MNIISRIVVAGSLLGAALAAPLAAQEQAVELKGDVKAVKTVTDAEGNTTTELASPDIIIPGDRLVFITSYHNTSSEPAENFVVTNPLPAAVRLAPDADADLTVSVDGGENFARLTSLNVTNDDGTIRAADHADVTHIRWTLATVAPGDAGELRYQVIIR